MSNISYRAKCPKCGREGKIMETEGRIRTWVCGECVGFWEEKLKPDEY